ncbi:protein C1orf43 homolog [Patella vulgata]|uniref:protein C1orf43 homolog n=1 Tax=Patella vulgata TaxID=6465 RepID=UPI00217FF3A3|nr:protein C1orf43 homolog [Patella vulgata]XP_050403641.1 protein C1orf43 homolog [Patella vulgata]
MAELSLVSVILFIATGALVFCILFLFAKRQIARFSFKSARRPHISIGYDIPKAMKLEIQRRFDRVQFIKYEPVLLTEKVQQISATVPNHYHYRMKALDAFSNAIECLMKKDETIKFRNPNETIQHYLSSLCPASINDTHDAAIIHHFAQSYDHARHDPSEFRGNEFVIYMELLDTVIRMIQADRVNRASSLNWKESPTDTEVVFEPGKYGTQDQTRTKKSACSSTSEAGRLKHRSKSKSKTEQLESINLVESKSSGYSSTDRSSSSRSSVEKLLPLSQISDKEESV